MCVATVEAHDAGRSATDLWICCEERSEERTLFGLDIQRSKIFFVWSDPVAWLCRWLWAAVAEDLVLRRSAPSQRDNFDLNKVRACLESHTARASASYDGDESLANDRAMTLQFFFRDVNMLAFF